MNTEEIYALLEESFAETQRGAQVVHDFSRDKQLLGVNGVFDSLDTMLFLDLVDEKLSAKLGRQVDLVDSDAFSRKDNPFANMATLASYIEELVNPAE